MPVIGKIGLGQIGGATQKLFGVNPISTWLRNTGGQLSGGQRSFNIVPPVSAAEVNPTQGSAARYNIYNNGMYSAPGNQNVLGSNNFSDNNNNQKKTGGGNDGTYNPTNDIIKDTQQGASEDSLTVEQEYENAINALANEEQWQSNYYGNMQSSAKAAGTAQENRLSESKEAELQSAAGQEATARSEESSGLRTMRDLFRQIQQQNIMDLSGRGISSSSVAEALAEKLGVETMRRIGDITQGTQTVINNIAAEKSRIVKVFETKKQELWDKVGLQIEDIQAKLSYALGQIRTQRGQAAIEKQKGLRDIAQGARDMINNIKTKAWEYEQSLAQEATKRQQATDDAIELLKFNENTGAYELNPMVQSAQSSLSAGFPGLGVAPQVQYYGGEPYIQGYSTFQKTKEQNPYEPDSPEYLKWEIMNS